MNITPILALFDPATDQTLQMISLTVGGLLAAAWYAKQLFWGDNQSTKISNQPLDVRIVEALHDQFADKQIFEAHVRSNTDRHGQIFNRIEKVERDAREVMDKKFTLLNEERRATLEKLTEQFTFIRENIAAINRELKIRGKE